MYYELWTILNRWKKEFSTAEFARTFYSPDARKVLHDMAAKGLLEHIEYGRYKVRSLDEYRDSKKDIINEGYELLRSAEPPYALTEGDSVFVWTKGGYNADRFFGFYPIHLKVLRSELEKWKSFFSKHEKKAILAETKPTDTLFGVFYVLHPVGKIKAETVEDLKVESLAKTVGFCEKNIYTYEPALEMLNEEYDLGLNVRYSK